MNKQFCVLTTGRSGTSALFQALDQHADIMSPRKQTGSGSRELVNPSKLKHRYTQYSDISHRIIDNPDTLIDAYLASNKTVAYVGFKLLYSHVSDWIKFNKRKFKLIIITRDDLASQIASFRLAQKTRNWVELPPPSERNWGFNWSESTRVKALGLEILKQNRLLAKMKGIHFTYEELSQPNFTNDELNNYFDRPIQLIDPKGPTNAEDYVQNWSIFKDFVDREILGKLVT